MNKTRNNFEKKIYSQLKRARVRFAYEESSFPYILARKYIPDFTIRLKSGRVLYIETKGYLRPEDKSKLIAVRKCNPHIDLRIVFQTNNKRQIKWAEKNKFPYAIEKIPISWLKE